MSSEGERVSNQIPHQYMVQIPERFYGQIIYNDQKCFFLIENNVLGPLEKQHIHNFYLPTKCSF